MKSQSRYLFSKVFSKHFRDTVDILVGWHIDHTQSISLIMYCAGMSFGHSS